MKVVAILQARTSSSRLPGKVLMEINQKTIIEHVVHNVRAARLVDHIVVATSEESNDDPIESLCIKENIDFYRGSLIDVLDRYYKVSQINKADIIVRVTCDCPLVSAITIDKSVSELIDGRYDYFANTCPPKTSIYPDGSDVEVFTYDALKKAYYSKSKYVSREHVTFQFWQDKSYKSKQLKDLKRNLNKYRYTLDYQEDFEVISYIINSLGNQKNHTVEDVAEILDKNKKIKELNSKYHFGIGWK